MKKILKKNQIIVTALAVLIAVAGYLNYTDNLSKTRMTGRRRRKNGVMIEQHFYFCSRIVLFMIY